VKFAADALLKPQHFDPEFPAAMRHALRDHPLLSFERLAALAQALPRRCIEYNAGDLPIGQNPATTPANGLTIEETLRRISDRQSWMAIKNVERDAAYRQLLNQCLEEIRPLVAERTGHMHKHEAFVFISSPGSVTPFHMDPEHNILLQIRGRKTVSVFPTRNPTITPPEAHEAFHQPGGHRNLAFRAEFETLARAFKLAPGEGLYVPVKAPHWVKVGGDVSISLSITWRSRASDAEARLYRVNAWLRARGADPALAGEAPVRDRLKALAARVAARVARG